MTQHPFLISGAIGSPYTRKLKAVLSYRRIPYQFLHAGMPGQRPREDVPKPPRPLLPCLYFPEKDGSYRAGSDTTFLIRELEALHAERSLVPGDINRRAQRAIAKLALFVASWITAFALLPVGWVVLALLAYAAIAAPGIVEVHRAFQSVEE